MIDSITLVVEPQRSVPLSFYPETLSQLVLPRDFYRCDLLAEELRKQAVGEVTVFEGFLSQLPLHVLLPKGFVLLFASPDPSQSIQECAATRHSSFLNHVVPMVVTRHQVADLLEAYDLPAIIEQWEYNTWRVATRPTRTPYKLYGLRHLAQRYGAKIDTIVSKRYAILYRDKSKGLAASLVHYLEEYSTLLPAPSTQVPEVSHASNLMDLPARDVRVLPT